jgi:hypothetical protein
MQEGLAVFVEKTVQRLFLLPGQSVFDLLSVAVLQKAQFQHVD